MRADTADGESSVNDPYPTGDNRLNLPDPKTVTYIDYDNPFVLADQNAGNLPHIMQLSPNAWVDCGEDIYVLECFGKGHVRIEPVSGGEHDLRRCQATSPPDLPFRDSGSHFRAHYSPTIHSKTASTLNVSRFQKNRKVLDASSLADAVRGCDTYAAEKVLRGPLSHALVAFLSCGQTPLLNIDQDYGAERSGGKGRQLRLKNWSWQRGGDTFTSL
jgi:ATP-dependent helicase IRC3